MKPNTLPSKVPTPPVKLLTNARFLPAATELAKLPLEILLLISDHLEKNSYDQLRASNRCLRQSLLPFAGATIPFKDPEKTSAFTTLLPQYNQSSRGLRSATINRPESLYRFLKNIGPQTLSKIQHLKIENLNFLVISDITQLRSKLLQIEHLDLEGASEKIFIYKFLASYPHLAELTLNIDIFGEHRQDFLAELVPAAKTCLSSLKILHIHTKRPYIHNDISNNFLGHILSQCSHLQKLHLVHETLKHELPLSFPIPMFNEISTLISILSGNTHILNQLEELTINISYFTPTFFQALSPYLRQLKTLKTPHLALNSLKDLQLFLHQLNENTYLDIQRLDLTLFQEDIDESLGDILKLLNKSKNLTHLDLGDKKIKLKNLAKILANHLHLKILSFNLNRISDLQNIPQNLKTYINQQISGSSSLEEVQISIEDDYAENSYQKYDILTILDYFSSLKGLNLSLKKERSPDSWKITPKLLANLLPKLEYLNLANTSPDIPSTNSSLYKDLWSKVPRLKRLVLNELDPAILTSLFQEKPSQDVQITIKEIENMPQINYVSLYHDALVIEYQHTVYAQNYRYSKNESLTKSLEREQRFLLLKHWAQVNRLNPLTSLDLVLDGQEPQLLSTILDRGKRPLLNSVSYLRVSNRHLDANLLNALLPSFPKLQRLELAASSWDFSKNPFTSLTRSLLQNKIITLDLTLYGGKTPETARELATLKNYCRILRESSQSSAYQYKFSSDKYHPRHRFSHWQLLTPLEVN